MGGLDQVISKSITIALKINTSLTITPFKIPKPQVTTENKTQLKFFGTRDGHHHHASLVMYYQKTSLPPLPTP